MQRSIQALKTVQKSSVERWTLHTLASGVSMLANVRIH